MEAEFELQDYQQGYRNNASKPVHRQPHANEDYNDPQF